MHSFFRTASGRLSLVMGGVDLALMGFASLAESPQTTLALVALIPMLSVAAAIIIVVHSTMEIGGLLPIGLVSLAIVLGGVYVYGLEQATHAGPGAGVVLLSIGTVAALFGIRRARVTSDPVAERLVTAE